MNKSLFDFVHSGQPLSRYSPIEKVQSTLRIEKETYRVYYVREEASSSFFFRGVLLTDEKGRIRETTLLENEGFSALTTRDVLSDFFEDLAFT